MNRSGFLKSLYRRTLLVLGALLVLWLLGLILDNKDPVDFIWESFWFVIFVVVAFSMCFALYAIWKDKKKNRP